MKFQSNSAGIDMKEVVEINWIEKRGIEINFTSEKMGAVLIVIFFDNFVCSVINYTRLFFL